MNTRKQFKAPDNIELSNRFIQLEADLAKAGLFETMHAVNVAKKKLGWEIARMIEKELKK